MPRNSARYALRFVRRAVMNAPNRKGSIVSNALKSVISALKNAGKWQRNNGSAQESDGDGILGCFLEYHKFRPGYSHPLGLQQ
jgi:hypothetical protein